MAPNRYRGDAESVPVIEGPEPKHRDPKSDRPWSLSPPAGTRLGPAVGDDPVPVEAKSLLGPKKTVPLISGPSPEESGPKSQPNFESMYAFSDFTNFFFISGIINGRIAETQTSTHRERERERCGRERGDRRRRKP